jgi:hypothetical protein
MEQLIIPLNCGYPHPSGGLRLFLHFQTCESPAMVSKAISKFLPFANLVFKSWYPTYLRSMGVFA